MNSKNTYNAAPLTLKRMISHLEPRFQKIEEELQKIQKQLLQYTSHFDLLFKKFEDLEQRYLSVDAQKKRLDQKVTKL